MKEKEKKIIGWEWAPDEKIEITGSQFNYINQLAEMFKPLMAIASNTLGDMAKNGKAKPVYEEDKEAVKSDIEVVSRNLKEDPMPEQDIQQPKMAIVKD